MIKKAPQDYRFYKYIKNGNMDVILIFDKKIIKSAFCITFQIGSLDEPDDVNGIAHLLEHLLISGENNKFYELMEKEDGTYNASTSDTHTNFYFEIDTILFERAIKLISPILKKRKFSANEIKKEIKLINDEYLMNIGNDLYRIFHVIKESIINNKKMASFNIGNISTLSKKNIVKLVGEFHEKYFSCKSVLVIHSNIPLEQQEHLIKKYFTIDFQLLIKKNKLCHNNIIHHQNNKINCIHIKTLEKHNLLIMQWFLPNRHLYYDCKPLQILSYILKSCVDNSINYIMLKHKYIEEINTNQHDIDDITIYS